MCHGGIKNFLSVRTNPIEIIAFSFVLTTINYTIGMLLTNEMIWFFGENTRSYKKYAAKFKSRHFFSDPIGHTTAAFEYCF